MKINPTVNRGDAIFSQMKIWFALTPAWWAWLLSGIVWLWLLVHEFSSMGADHSMHHMHGANVIGAIVGGLMPWVVMIIAMMFPMLNESISHVAFSVQQKNKVFGIIFFLLGYTFTWTIVGMLLSLIIMGIQKATMNFGEPLVNIIPVLGFLLAAALVWLPKRSIDMTACGKTIPIRIRGLGIYQDAFRYGLTTGVNCARTCWAPMAALMLAHHDMWTMLIVTIIIVYERYRLPHTSKVVGYAWGIIALSLLTFEILPRI